MTIKSVIFLHQGLMLADIKLAASPDFFPLITAIDITPADLECALIDTFKRI